MPSGTKTKSSSRSPLAEKVIGYCEKHWEEHKDNCSGFAKAVATECGIFLHGDANSIIKQIDAEWQSISSGVKARDFAEAGHLVLAGLEEDPHGHVVVVVSGPLAHGKYPTAYWGKYQSVGKKKTTLNYAWRKEPLKKIKYYGVAVRDSNPLSSGPSVKYIWGRIKQSLSELFFSR